MKKKIALVLGIILCLIVAWNLGTNPSQTVVYTPGQNIESTVDAENKAIEEEVQKEENVEKGNRDQSVDKEQIEEKTDTIKKEDEKQEIGQVEPIEEENKQQIEAQANLEENIPKESIKLEVPKQTTVQKQEHSEESIPPTSNAVEVTKEELAQAQTDKKQADALKQEIIDNQDYSKKDKYMTDPVPEGKPKPVEPQDVKVDKATSFKVKLSVSCGTILNNMKLLDKNKYELVPDNGIIFPLQEVTAYNGESVFDVLLREMQNNKIHMEFVNTPMYNSAYIEGINNLYEFDVGELSGWMYKVNEWFPNYGCSRYQVDEGDVIEWVYTCDLGRDVGDSYYEK